MKKFITSVFYIFLITIIIYQIYIKVKNRSNMSTLLGYSCLKVISGSMSPDIMEGENIIIKKCNNYEIGDIITYLYNDEIITHRIVEIKNDLYYTKGDLNNTVDFNPIEYNQIYGKVIYHFKLNIPNLKKSYSKYVETETFSVYYEKNETE